MTEGPVSGPGIALGDGSDSPYSHFIPVTLPPSDTPASGTPSKRTRWSRLTGWAGSHLLSVEIGAVVVALLAGTGIGLAFDGGGSGSVASSTSAAPTPGAQSPTPAAGNPFVGPAQKLQFVRGQITAESTSTWTVVTPRGRGVTVTLTPTTKFGTAVSPSSAAQFVVGGTAVVRGKLSGSTITAVRIVVPSATSVPTTSVPTTQG